MATGDVVLEITNLGVITESATGGAAASNTSSVNTRKVVQFGDSTPANSSGYNTDGTVGGGGVTDGVVDITFDVQAIDYGYDPNLNRNRYEETGYQNLFAPTKKYKLTITEV